ncbi:hypothetical protein EDC94DRAFT_644071 [Helicostylum pulchrum]|nr:hypothetical protein EDC94DRAFT_644071 [Helicostylum pulchrum]
MRRKKQRQFLRATPALNQLSTWRRKGQKRTRRNLLESESESEPTDKKMKDAEREEELLGAFQREMKRRLSRTIQDFSDYRKDVKGKGKEVEVEVLSQKIEETSLIEEDEYVPSSSSSVSKTQTVESLHQPEGSSDNPTELDMNEEEDEKTRHCSSSLLPLIRSDLPADIKDTFLRVLKGKLTAATDYTIDFGVQAHKMINLLRACTFVKDGNSVKMQQKRGPQLQDILPTNYQLEKKGDIFLPPPLDFSCLKTANLVRNFSKLFSKAHLQLIHSTYFGPQGLREGSTKTQYFHNAFVDILPRNIKKAFTTDPYVMKMSLSKYATNFEVMWSDSKRPLKVLNRLLDILLKYILHRSENRKMEQKRQLYISEKEATTIQRPIGIIKKSRNGKRNLFNNERRRRRKYVKKAKDDPFNEQKWINKAIRCTERIETYAETLAIERTKAIDIDPSDTSGIELDTINGLYIEQRRRAIEKEEEEVVESTDLSRKRLAVFRSILRQVIFKYHGQHITEVEVRDFSNTTYTKEEIRVLSSIANFLMPYIPTKQTWYTTAYQIPFILMSNNIMRYTGYQKSCVAVSPLSKPSSLHCFKIDAPTLFSSFCDSNLEQPMDIYGFDGNVILSRRLATESKDAVFRSFFNLAEIKKVTASYGLDFQHNMSLLPGLKTVRITGTLTKPTKQNMATVLESKDTLSKPKKSLLQKEKRDAETKRNASQEEIENLDNQLRALYVKLNKNREQFDIRAMKKKWIIPQECPEKEKRFHQNQALYIQIAEQKEYDQALSKEKAISSSLRHETTDYQIKVSTSIEKKLLITKENYKCIDNVENISIDEKFVQSEEVSFSDPSEFQESDYLSLPKTFKINSNDIDHGSGQKKIRQHLIRSRKESIVGQEVQKLELDLCKEDLSSALTTADINNWYEKQKSARVPLRNFYYSSKRNKRKRTYELQKQKYVDQLCSKERKYVSSSGNTVPILFVGDRVYGIGSQLKGHSRQGEYVSVLASKNTHGRDSLSAFAIGFPGLAMLMYGVTFPTFAPNTSHFKTEFFNQKAVAFLNRNAKRPTVDDVVFFVFVATCHPLLCSNSNTEFLFYLSQIWDPQCIYPLSIISF